MEQKRITDGEKEKYEEEIAKIQLIDGRDILITKVSFRT